MAHELRKVQSSELYKYFEKSLGEYRKLVPILAKYEILSVEMTKLEGMAARYSTRKKSKYGNHYAECSWSDDNTRLGPDTCCCVYSLWSYKRIMDAMKEMRALLEEEDNKIDSDEECSEGLYKRVLCKCLRR
jgi:hypothetical protein